jgi:hypothetical protein
VVRNCPSPKAQIAPDTMSLRNPIIFSSALYLLSAAPGFQLLALR